MLCFWDHVAPRPRPLPSPGGRSGERRPVWGPSPSPAVRPVREELQFSWGLGHPWQGVRWPKPGLQSGPVGAGNFHGCPGPKLLQCRGGLGAGWAHSPAAPAAHAGGRQRRREEPLHCPSSQMGKLRHSAVNRIQRSGCPFGCLSGFCGGWGSVWPPGHSHSEGDGAVVPPEVWGCRCTRTRSPSSPGVLLCLMGLLSRSPVQGPLEGPDRQGVPCLSLA